MPWRENKGVANLNGIYTDIFGGLLRKKSLEEIFVKMLLTQEILWIRSLSPNKIFNENH